MKSWSRLCFLVLATSSLCRGQNETSAPTSAEETGATLAPTPAPLSPDETENKVNPTPPDPASQNHTTTSAMDLLQEAMMTTPTTGDSKHTVNDTAEEDDHSPAAQTTATASLPGNGAEGDGVDVTTTVSMTTTNAPSKPVAIEDDKEPSSSMGYVILALMIVVIVALCVILYILRRVSRTYSFDLQRPVPMNHFDEPTGTFEPVYVDDLVSTDQVTTDDPSPPPVANGTGQQSQEKSSDGENNAPQGQPDTNGVETSLTSNTSPSLGDDPADKTPSPLGDGNLLFDDVGEEQQNENNNNNPLVCSSDPFVEINLDDPTWCDQFLTSTEATSSVLPFTPLSFSSSSSSS